MVPHRYATWVFVFFMIVLMGLALSGIFQAIEGEPGLATPGAFVMAWLKRFASTYVIVIPTVLAVLPIARWLTTRVVRSTGDGD